METKLFKYIAVAYKLYADIDDENQLVEEATENQPYQYISGMGMNLPAFENAIEGMGKDDSFDFTIPQAEAYGEYVDERVVELDKEIFKVDGKITACRLNHSQTGLATIAAIIRTMRTIIDCIQQIRFPNPIITYQTIDVGAEIHIQFCIGLKVV